MIGQLATSKAGHDKGTLYVIVAEEDGFAYLSDGRLRPPERPKKKRIKHLQPINRLVEGELRNRLQRNETVYAEEIRYALEQYGKRRHDGKCKENRRDSLNVNGSISESY